MTNNNDDDSGGDLLPEAWRLSLGCGLLFWFVVIVVVWHVVPCIGNTD